MVFVHIKVGEAVVRVDPGLPYLQTGDWLSPTVMMLRDAFGRISSPLLGFLSGFFLLGNLQDRAYFTVLLLRLRTLYLPVVIWSTVCVLVMLSLIDLVYGSAAVTARLSIFDANTFLGITKWPFNYALHYMVDLVKCILFVPLFLFVLERAGRFAFLSIVVAIFLALIGTDLNPPHPGVNRESVLPRADLFLFFYLGLFVKWRDRDAIGDALDRLRLGNGFILAVIGIVFIVGAGHWRWLAASEDMAVIWAGGFLLLATRIAGCLLLLAALPWLRRIGRRRLYIPDRLTFYLFCTHVITIAALEAFLVTYQGEIANALGMNLYPTLLAPMILVFALSALIVATLLWFVDRAVRRRLFKKSYA